MLFLLLSLDKSVLFFSPKVFISLTLFILTCIRKRVLQRLRKGFRNITFNEKKLESTSNTAGASENFHFRSLLWESPELLLGLCSLLFLPHFTACSHCSVVTEETHFFYSRVSEKEIISTIYWGNRGIGFFTDLDM